MNRLPAAVALALLWCALPVSAQQPTPPAAPAKAASPPAWEQLTTADRDALIAPLRERWNSADADKRQRMLEHARQWRTMTPEERHAAHKGLRRWSHLSPDQRDQARALFEQMRAMTPEERRVLREQWQTMTPEQRKAWLEHHPPQEAPRRPPAR